MNKGIKITFALIILLTWGISLLSGLKTDPKGVAGKIDTKTYTFAEYDKILDNYFSFWTSREGKKLTADRKKELNDKCWEEQIGVYLYDSEIKKRRLGVSDQEAYNEAITNTPADVKQIEALKVNGKFSIDKFKEAMEKDPKFKDNVLSYMKNMMRYDKLLNTIRSEAKVKPDSVKQAWQKDNNTFSGKILAFESSTVKAPAIADSEAVAYYKANYETYKRDPARKYKYVKFTSTITAADSAFAKVKADSLYNALIAGADFAEMAARFSADPGSAQKGGVYDWFARGRMVKPFEDTAFTQEVNTISQPVKTQFGWHIIKTLEKRNLGEPTEEVRAAHILIKPEVNPQTTAKNKSDAERIYTLALVMGLTEAAKYVGYNTEQTAEFYANAKSIQNLGSFPELITTAFSQKVGYLNKPVTSPRGEMFVTQISDSLGVHYAAFETEKAGIVSKIQGEKKVAINKANALAYYEAHINGDLMAAAAADSMKIVEVKDIKAGAALASIGNATAIVDSMLALEAGKYTQVLEYNKNAYIGLVTARAKPDMKKWEKNKAKILKDAKTQVQNNHLNTWYAAKRGALKIEDNRKEYYELNAPQNNSQQIQIKPN